ncbi:hypothetical protein CVT24_010971 [Panaeolus cyanescens]|uniref:Uncharacterized protein n=1 Tax=Panaeolus cyanescens TaxID=181874 RepID=A0A409WE79_9AGAR|nr:hypothetical protein CVT24_010971 [Panaeolus cyanescens]
MTNSRTATPPPTTSPSSSPQIPDSPKPKQKWASKMSTVVRRASKRFSIPRMHSHDSSSNLKGSSALARKSDSTASGSVDLKRASTSSEESAQSKPTSTAHVKSESAPAAVISPVLSSEPTAVDDAPALQDSTTLDKSLVIVPLAQPVEPTEPAVSSTDSVASPPLATEEPAPVESAESNETLAHTHILLPPSQAQPVMARVNLDESMVEVVVPLEEEEDDAVAVAAPLKESAAVPGPEKTEQTDSEDVRLASDVQVTESRTTVDDEDLVHVAKEGLEASVVPVVVDVAVEGEVSQPELPAPQSSVSTSEEDQRLLDSTVIPREEDTISIIDSTPTPTTTKSAQPEIVVDVSKAPTVATVTIVSPTTHESTSGHGTGASSSSSSSGKSPSHTTTLIIALVTGTIVGVGALAYAGVIAGISVGGIVAGVGGSLVTGWKSRRRSRA